MGKGMPTELDAKVREYRRGKSTAERKSDQVRSGQVSRQVRSGPVLNILLEYGTLGDLREAKHNGDAEGGHRRRTH